MKRTALLATLSLLSPACGGGGDPCAEDNRCHAEHRRCLVVDGRAVCGDCLPGFHEEAQTCVADQACEAGSCSGHGTCSLVGGVIDCACDAGYTGADCSSCAAGYHDDGAGGCAPDGVDPCQPGACSGHGTCDGSSGQAVCTCDAGYAGPACADCAPGHSRDPTSGLCVEDAACCQIGDDCLPVGSVDPARACAVCDPDRDPAGWSPALPGTGCRPSAGYCDAAEACDGTSLDCPEDPMAYLGGAWSATLTATQDAVYCLTYREWNEAQGTGLEEAYRQKTQARVLPGAYRLPDAAGSAPYRLPACVTFLEPQASPALSGVGQVTATYGQYATSFQVEEPLEAPGGEGYTLQIRLGAAPGTQAFTLDGADPDMEGLGASVLVSPTAGGELRGLESCTFPNWVAQDVHRVEFQGGWVELTVRFGATALFPGPAVFLQGRGELDGVAFDQLDYWRLVYSAPHHHFSDRAFVVLFDQPISGVCGLRVEGLEPFDGVLPAVSLAGCDLQPLSARTPTHQVTTRETRW